MESIDCIISFQEATTGLPITGQFIDYERGWQFTLDDCAKEWAEYACPSDAAANMEEARKECKRLTAAVRGMTNPKDVCRIVRKHGHSSEII